MQVQLHEAPGSGLHGGRLADSRSPCRSKQPHVSLHCPHTIRLGAMLLPIIVRAACRVAVDIGMEPGWPVVDKAYNGLLNFVRDRS